MSVLSLLRSKSSNIHITPPRSPCVTCRSVFSSRRIKFFFFFLEDRKTCYSNKWKNCLKAMQVLLFIIEIEYLCSLECFTFIFTLFVYLYSSVMHFIAIPHFFLSLSLSYHKVKSYKCSHCCFTFVNSMLWYVPRHSKARRAHKRKRPVSYTFLDTPHKWQL